jgi:threonine synthase
LPEEFHGLLDKEKRVVDIEIPDLALVKDAIEKIVEGGKNEAASLASI